MGESWAGTCMCIRDKLTEEGDNWKTLKFSPQGHSNPVENEVFNCFLNEREKQEHRSESSSLQDGRVKETAPPFQTQGAI